MIPGQQVYPNQGARMYSQEEENNLNGLFCHCCSCYIFGTLIGILVKLVFPLTNV
jgi:hypothetical protein